MNCPNCQADTVAGENCPACGMTLDLLDEMFGALPRHQGSVSDIEGVTTSRQRSSIARSIDFLTHTFPQCTFSVLFMRLPQDAPVRLYGFWLFNRGRFSRPSAKLGHNYSLLLIIDSGRREVGVTCGYGLEPFLDDAQIQGALLKGGDALGRGHAARAAIRILDGLRRELKKSWRRFRVEGHDTEKSGADESGAGAASVSKQEMSERTRIDFLTSKGPATLAPRNKRYEPRPQPVRRIDSSDSRY